MEPVKLGKLCDEAAQRDAIHIAIAPVVVGDKLVLPGLHVGLLPDGRVSTQALPFIGVIDPFLIEPVGEGERCYLCLYPQTVTSLRHEWTHPAFGQQAAGTAVDKDASRLWIEAFAGRILQRYDDLMAAADEFVRTGEHTYDNNENYKDHWDDFPAFWRHYEIVTGTTVRDEDKEYVPFACSC